MLTLKEDFPDIADEIVRAANLNEPLREALSDYEQVCARMDDTEITAGERSQWTEIRAELVLEIRRIVTGLSH